MMLEVIKDAIGPDEPERVPVIPFVMHFAARTAGIDYSDYCKDASAMAESQIKCLEKFGYDAANVSSDAHRLAEALGGELRFPKDGVPSVIERPVKSKEDLKDMNTPDPKESERCVARIDAIRKIKERYPEIPVIGWIEGALSDASSIHGIAETLLVSRKEPDFFEELLRFAVDFDLKFAKYQVEAGADIIGAGDSLASQISSDNFGRCVEYTKEIFESLKVPTLYHVCGDATHQLENLKNSGADIIDLDWQVNLRKAREKLGSEICIRGNINPTLFLDQGPERIKEFGKRCIEMAGEEGNFILSAGCEIPPGSKDENLRAMIETAKSHRYQ